MDVHDTHLSAVVAEVGVVREKLRLVFLDELCESRDCLLQVAEKAFVIFERPIPRMSANASKSCLNGCQGTSLPVPASEAPGAMACSASSIARRRSRVAAISAAEMRAPPRFANLRSDSSNEDAVSPASKRHDSRYPLTTCRGSWISISSRRLTGVIDVVFTQPG